MKPGTKRIAAPSILLIEDTASLQLIYRSVLEKVGYVVQVANSAADGMALFSSQLQPSPWRY